MRDTRRARNATRWGIAWAVLGTAIAILGIFDLVNIIYVIVCVPTTVIVSTLHEVRADLHRTRTTVTVTGDGGTA